MNLLELYNKGQQKFFFSSMTLMLLSHNISCFVEGVRKL